MSDPRIDKSIKQIDDKIDHHHEHSNYE